jgi:cytosine/adenosine deaminase-related metal-dependent hydrolase
MRRYSANYVFTNTGNPIRNGIVGVNDNGVVVEIIDPQGHEKELASTEFHNGVIVPGFINAHCHTELSHLKGRTQKGTGLAGFVSQIRDSRLKGEKLTDRHISDALIELKREGIVAVADICNTSDSYPSKQDNKIQFVNLIELLGLDSSMAEFMLERARNLQQISYETINSKAYLTPHSVYSISEKLWEKLGKDFGKSNLLSIHFAESKSEKQFTEQRSGEIAQNYLNWGLPLDDAPSGNPVEISKRYLPTQCNILFVHNTYLEREEALNLSAHFPRASFVLCPASNLYIERTLPNIPMLMDLKLNIVLGTDSLASSPTLSILDQMLIIQKHFRNIPFDEMLRWATINGANALGFNEKIGSIEFGKSPGLNLITNFDFGTFKPSDTSRVKRLV